MYINSALLKLKSIDAKIQGMLLKTNESIGIVSSTNIQHRWKIKMLQLHPETQLMMVNSILACNERIEPTVWAGLPLTENQMIAFITCKEDVDMGDDNHKSVTETYRYLDDIVTHYNASITPAMKEHILKLFPTPLDSLVPTGDNLTASTVTGAGLYMHELELLLKLFSPQELLQRFPDPNSNIWNTNQDLCDTIAKRKYTIKLGGAKVEHTFKVTQPQYCDIITVGYEQVNITDIKVDDIVLSSKTFPDDIDDLEESSHYGNGGEDDIHLHHKHRFKVLDITYV
jgi:hypothetical protein